MSVVERKHKWLRTAAACCAGVVLMGSAYQASFAAGFHASANDYGGGGGGAGFPEGSDDNTDTAEIAALAILGAGGAYVALNALGVFGGHGSESTVIPPAGEDRKEENKEKATPLPADARVSSLRLVAPKGVVEAGTTAVFDLQAKNAADGKWYSVTTDPNASIRVSSPEMVAVQGTKNAFCVPVTVSDKANGKTVSLTGSYARQGGPAFSANTQVVVSVPAL